MNTHDKYELPPVPKPKKGGLFYERVDLKDYARAAVEADRKRRGEPVAWRWRWKTDGSPLERRFADPDLYEWAYRNDRPTGESAKLMIIEALYDAPQPADPDAATVADYEEALADHRRLVRELDVLLNGEEGAAEQASLCDIVAQVRREGIKTAEPVKVPSDSDSKHVQDFINCDGMGAMIVEGPQYSAVVRTLLARYGQQATPQEPPSSD